MSPRRHRRPRQAGLRHRRRRRQGPHRRVLRQQPGPADLAHHPVHQPDRRSPQREVESNPNITDPNSTVRGPGFVAPIGIGGHFPPERRRSRRRSTCSPSSTPTATASCHPGPDRIKGTGRRHPAAEPLQHRPRVRPAGQALDAAAVVRRARSRPCRPTDRQPQSRGIATLPGGIPLYKNGVARRRHRRLLPRRDRLRHRGELRPERRLSTRQRRTARWRPSSSPSPRPAAARRPGFPVGTLGGVPALPGFDLPFGRIDLVGITLDIFGPGGDRGPQNLVDFASANLGVGAGNAGDRHAS